MDAILLLSFHDLDRYSYSWVLILKLVVSNKFGSVNNKFKSGYTLKYIGP